MEPANVDVQDEPRKRPTGVVVVAVFMFIFTAFGLCCTPVFSIGYFNPSDPAMMLIRSSTAALAVSVLHNFLVFVMGILNLILGIGLLKLKEGSRKGTVAVSIFWMIFYTFHSVASFFILNPIMMQGMNAQMEAQSQGRPMPAGFMEFMNKFGEVGITIVSICTLLFVYGISIVFIFYLTRPKVKAAFQPVP